MRTFFSLIFLFLFRMALPFLSVYSYLLNSNDQGQKLTSPTASKISAGRSNITLQSSSWQMKFIHYSQVSAANRVYRNGIKLHLSFIKMSDRNLKFVYLFCQTGTFLFLLNRTSPSSSYMYCKHPFSRNEHLQYMEIYY